MRFLSLGAGVQSTVMLMLSIRDEIERPDHVIFADTGWEPEGVYKHVQWCKKQCKKAGIPFHEVSNGNIRMSAFQKGRTIMMPVFTINKNGEKGMVGRRVCTSEYKIIPVRRKMRELLGYQPKQRIPVGETEVMVGISTDEARRASQPTDKWVENVFPLIDPMRFSRADCQSWWEQHYPHVNLTKSSCIGCPFQSDQAWRERKIHHPVEFEDACLFDEHIRQNKTMDDDCYLHRSCVPLRDLDLNESQSEMDLEDEVYCAGGCGL